MTKGLIVVLSGASSVGKQKIRDLVLKDKQLNLFYSVSMTTRPKKANETNGKDYYFVSYERFAQAVKEKELLEFTQVNGYYYGTPIQQIDFLIDKGTNVLIEVEAQGVGQIKLIRPEAIAFFVMPKSLDELEKQLHERYKDNAFSIDERLAKARMEMELAPLFRYTVQADQPKEAAAFILKTVKEALAQ
ncbi:MAG: guanylate kinase [Erysipelotrichaceae bacterium]|jgi:guanylate kinase|nr:guanylate kinase [Erysipelotrichaceae bacterium]